MNKLRIVIALGGNALETKGAEASSENQISTIKKSVKPIVDIMEMGYEVVISHGNGPQVGRILLQNEAGASITPSLPLDVLGAMTQGYIGYHIQQALKNEFELRGLNREAVTVVTQVEIDVNSDAFRNPTKPIGPFYSQEEATLLEKGKGYVLKEDAGRGYRRVVASPYPLKTVELKAIKSLIENNFTVISCGGGGIPVSIDEKNNLKGIEAVIDKDFASMTLAKELDADILLVLTEVEKVAVNFNKPDQQWLDKLSISDAEEYIKQNQFAPGSMLPKVKAAMEFVESKENRRAIITSLSKATSALKGLTGTEFIR